MDNMPTEFPRSGMHRRDYVSTFVVERSGGQHQMVNALGQNFSLFYGCHK